MDTQHHPSCALRGQSTLASTRAEWVAFPSLRRYCLHNCVVDNYTILPTLSCSIACLPVSSWGPTQLDIFNILLSVFGAAKRVVVGLVWAGLGTI